MDGISSLNTFLAEHRPQLVLSGVPEHFWPTLCKKLRDQIFDAGFSFQLVSIDYEGTEKMPYDPLWSVLAGRNMDANDSSHIYLVDHAWTFKVNSIKSNLRNMPGLLERMCSFMQINGDTDEDRIEQVAQSVWRYAHTYAIGGEQFSVEERTPLWYVLDELGSGITHSDVPNVRMVPFIHVPEQMTYSLLFPISDIEAGECIVRDFVEGTYSDPMQREAMLIPWKEYDYFKRDFAQIEPSSSYFTEGHIMETLPDLDFLKENSNKSTGKLKVYSEYRYINEYLTSPEFEIVDNEIDADIIWHLKHFKKYEQFSRESPMKFINQFPFEYVVTVKDLLAIVARRHREKLNDFNDELETMPSWLPTTFNMKNELPNLVSYYMRRKKAGLDNHWICKPYNLARGLDTHITGNLDFLCRLPLSGPKIAQKYIENPVLFNRTDVGLVKFDVRYVLLLKSVNPTEVYVYKNFFLRLSNKPFAMINFDDYEQHFTVMNYTDGASLYRLLCHEFKEKWGEQFDSFSWDNVEKSIFKMFADLFTAATCKDPPCGIAKSPQSRALYAADIMLSWDKHKTQMQPKLLEINWMPDCQRACEYYPDFYNDIFSVLFKDKDVESCIKIL